MVMKSLDRLRTVAMATLLLIVPKSSFCLGEKCIICEGTNNVGSPDKTLDLAEVGSFRCDDFNDILALWFPQDNASATPECQWIQSLGSLCDCPEKEEPRPDACDICPFSLGYPKRPLPFLKESLGGGIFTPTCEIVHAYLLSSAGSNGEACTGMEWIVSDYCGCGLINTEWHSSCSLCPSQNKSQTQPSTSNQDNILDRDDDHHHHHYAINQNNSSTDLTSTVTKPDRPLNIPGFPLKTCGELEEAVQLVFVEDSDQCSGLQQLLGIYCGCPADPKEDNKNVPCHLCPDGTSPIMFPDKEVPFLSHALFSGPSTTGTPLSFIPTCAIVESLALSVDASSEACEFLQLGASSICGCPPREEGHCEICPGYEGDFPPPEYKDAGLPILDYIFPGDFVPTCGMAVWFQYQLAPDDDFCHLLQARSDLCGCHDGQFVYNGADTHTQRVLITWLPRATALLSVMGSLAIIVDVLTTPARRKRVYNQLVLLMSIFDLINAAGFSLTTYPTPTHDQFGNDWKVYGSNGSDASCKAQAFALELGGITSIFFNASLATYYVCVFVFGWKDRGRESRRVWIWFLVLPIAAGLTLSLAGIPYYGNLLAVCYVMVPPRIKSYQPRLWLLSIPVVLTLFWGMIMMIMVYVSLLRRGTFIGVATQAIRRRTRQRCSRQEHPHQEEEMEMSERQRLQEEREVGFWKNQERIRQIKCEVFWQCLFYMAAFYLTWPVWLYPLLTINTPAHPEGFVYNILSLAIPPLQGFLNAIVYFRPRYWRYFQKRYQLGEEREQQQQLYHEEPESGNYQSADTAFVANTGKFQARRQSSRLRNMNLGSLVIRSIRSHHDAGEEDDDHRAVSETENFDALDLDGRIEPSAIIACDISAELEELRHRPHREGAHTDASTPSGVHDDAVLAALTATMASIPNDDHRVYA